MQDIPLISCDSVPLTEEQLLIVENAIGTLPSDYRQFLLNSNGGRTTDDQVRFPISDDESDDYFFTAFEVTDPDFPPEVLKPKGLGDDYQLLLSVAIGMAATSVPEENQKIIKHLVARGIRPDFDDPTVHDAWAIAIGHIYSRNILKILFTLIEFPENIAGSLGRSGK